MNKEKWIREKQRKVRAYWKIHPVQRIIVVILLQPLFISVAVGSVIVAAAQGAWEFGADEARGHAREIRKMFAG